MNFIWKKYIPSAVCVVGSLSLYALLSVMSGDSGPWDADGRILRGGYGSRAAEYEIFVSGFEDREIPMTISVGAQVYSEEEAKQAFEEIMDGMEERIRAENPSLMEVRGDLKLPSRIAERGVKLKWYSSDIEIMDSAGKLKKEVKEDVEVVLSVELSTDIWMVPEEEIKSNPPGRGRYRCNYEIPVRILPPLKTGREQLIADFQERLRQEDIQQQANPEYILPNTFEKYQIRYRMEKPDQYKGIVLIGLLAAILLPIREVSVRKEREKERERELLMDYSDVLSKLVVLVGAGLTVRNAWERIVSDYEEAKKVGGQRLRAAYEEMSWTCGRLKSGVSESDAYKEFGKRCRLPPYLKLASLLEQNRRTGMKDLRRILQIEMSDALEQRKNLAKRLGEEAGTKLLAPLFLMLGIIMIMIMVPAMMAMS